MTDFNRGFERRYASEHRPSWLSQRSKQDAIMSTFWKDKRAIAFALAGIGLMVMALLWRVNPAESAVLPKFLAETTRPINQVDLKVRKYYPTTISERRVSRMIATLSAKGQITIPVSIREFLGIKTGDAIDFVTTKSKTIELIPTHTPVQALRGLVSKPKRPVTLSEMDAAIATGGEK